MSNIDWTRLRKAADIAAQDLAETMAPIIQAEAAWAESERKYAGDAIEAIEDDGDDAPDGTILEWRAYRTAVRKWKLGADGFPDQSMRPIRP